MNKNLYRDGWHRRILPPQMLIPVGIAGIIIIIISAYLEYKSRHNDYMDMLEQQSAIFINTLRNNAKYANNAAAGLEKELTDNIYSRLNIIERLDRNTLLNRSELQNILKDSDFNDIHVYDSDLNLSLRAAESASTQVGVPEFILESSRQDTALRTLYISYEGDFLVGVVPRNNGGVIAGIISSDRIKHYRNLFGFGQIMRSFSEGESVEYIVLQNEVTIIAGFFNDYPISLFSNDLFLLDAFIEGNIKSRVIEYKRGDVYETVATFILDNEPVGLFRMGISMAELESITSRAKRRMFIACGLMVVIGLVFVNFILSFSHRQLLRRELSYLNIYTNTILDNLESGVITIDGNGRTKVINRKASEFLNLDYADVYGKSFEQFPEIFVETIKNCQKGIKPDNKPFLLPANGSESKWLSFRSTMLKEDENETCILLVDDITGQVQLEEQKRTNEKLAAMRRLASGVAHEIRNPLNSINLIVDFLSKRSFSDYNSKKTKKYFLTVQGEIRRISSIVEDFLRFARPPKLQQVSISFPAFFEELKTLYSPRIESGKLVLGMDIQTHPVYFGDPMQLKQVFVNLIENAIQANESQCRIKMTGIVQDGHYIISVRDYGGGISQNDLKNIFDLYFTTKQKGSGIGLAISHQIIARHKGTIEAKSQEGAWAEFVIQLPFEADLEEFK